MLKNLSPADTIASRSKVQDQECCQASSKIQKRLGHSIRQRCGMAACVYSCLKISKDGAVIFFCAVYHVVPEEFLLEGWFQCPLERQNVKPSLGHTPISHGSREAAHVFSERFSPTKQMRCVGSWPLSFLRNPWVVRILKRKSIFRALFTT